MVEMTWFSLKYDGLVRQEPVIVLPVYVEAHYWIDALVDRIVRLDRC